MKCGWIMVVVVTLVVLFAIIRFIAPVVAEPTSSTLTRVVEYKVVKSLWSEAPEAMQAVLDPLGKQGWELVTIKGDCVIFKR